MAVRDDVARHAVSSALAGVRKRDEILYSQDMTLRWGGIHNKIRLPQVPRYADCSSFTTWILHNARWHVRGTPGADVVNGTRWQSGYTGTQVGHGRLHRHGPKFWKAGRTLVFYGAPHDISHVAIYVGKDKATGKYMVVSHGQSSGPHFLPYNYRDDFIEARAYAV